MKRGVLIAALVSATLAWAGEERVTIPTAGLSDAPEALVGFLFRPAGSELRGAVVMLHGCGGAYARDGGLNARHRMWGEFLASRGYAALMLDSFTPRAMKELCTQKTAERTVRPAHRAGDAFAALAWLARQPGNDPKRVALMGWSHGGSAVLEAIDRTPPSALGFSRAIAFYPGCTPKAREPARFQPRAPLLLLVGDADDWTPAEPCKRLATALRQRGEKVSIVAYPDTFHDFDNPGLKKARKRTDVPNGVNQGQGVTVAPNPEAREDAKQRVLGFLSR